MLVCGDSQWGGDTGGLQEVCVAQGGFQSGGVDGRLLTHRVFSDKGVADRRGGDKVVVLGVCLGYDVGVRVGYGGPGCSSCWSLTQFYSVNFSQSSIGVQKCVFNQRTIKICVSYI